MLEEVPKKDIIFMTDADFCYVSNRTGEYNTATQECLKNNKDQVIHVAIITGRNATGLLGLLEKVQNLSESNWNQFKQNGLDAVEKDIGFCLAGEGKSKLRSSVICIPNDLIDDENGVRKPGQSYEKFRLSEIYSLNYDTPQIALQKFDELYKKIKLIDDDDKFAKMQIDKMTDPKPYGGKGDQVKFYLDSLPKDEVSSAAKIYMDDVSDNVVEVFTKNPDVISVLNNIEMGHGYNKQALDLAIKAANAEEEEREQICKDLIRAAIEFKQFRIQFSKEEGRNKLNHEDEITGIKVSLESDINYTSNCFKVVRDRLDEGSKGIVEQEFKEAIALRESNAQLARQEKEKQASSEINTHLDANNYPASQMSYSSSLSSAYSKSVGGEKRSEEKTTPLGSDCDKVMIGLTALAIGGVAVGCASALGVGLIVAVPVVTVVAVASVAVAFAVIEPPQTSPSQTEGHQFSSLQSFFSFGNKGG